MDGVVSPQTAALTNKLGGLGVLNLEGIWSRFENAEERLEAISSAPKHEATRLMQEIYAEPVKPELIGRRGGENKAARAGVSGAPHPPKRGRDYQGPTQAGPP